METNGNQMGTSGNERGPDGNQWEPIEEINGNPCATGCVIHVIVLPAMGTHVLPVEHEAPIGLRCSPKKVVTGAAAPDGLTEAG